MTITQTGNNTKITFHLHGACGNDRLEVERKILNHRVKQLEVGKAKRLFTSEEIHADD